jgi:hypothetical protein
MPGFFSSATAGLRIVVENATMPLVTIAIPAHNSAYIEQTLVSALNQDFDDYEVLVLDDSTDGSALAAVERHRNPRLRYIANPNRLGFHANFAECARQARGEYLKFLNHDDLLAPACLKEMVGAFTRWGSQISLVFARRAPIDASGAMHEDVKATMPLASRNGLFRANLLIDHCLREGLNQIGEPSAVMFRKCDLEPDAPMFAVNGRQYTCLADLSLWLRLLSHGDAFYLAERLVGYRIHSAQLQRASGTRILCCTEQFFLARDARASGFLQSDGDWMKALDIAGQYLEWAFGLPDLSPEERELCELAVAELSVELSKTQAMGTEP